MTSLKCTNPSCGSNIPVPVGAVQVICPTCNTWHFPSPEETKEENNPSSNDYNFPPPAPENRNPPPYNEQQPPPPPPHPQQQNNNNGYGQQQQPYRDENPYRQSPPPSPQNQHQQGYYEEQYRHYNGQGQNYPQENNAPEAIGFLETETGDRLALKEGKNVIGRERSDLIISDRTVSRRHCVLEVTSGNNNKWQYHIYDIGHLEGAPSTNGVFISGRSLRLQDYERIPINIGTMITLGSVRLVLRPDQIYR